MRDHSFICGKKTLRRFRETCKPGHFTLHIWGIAGADWAITTRQRAAHDAQLTFGFSSDIVAVFCVRVFFSQTLLGFSVISLPAAFRPLVSTADRRARFGPLLRTHHWFSQGHVTTKPRERASSKIRDHENRAILWRLYCQNLRLSAWQKILAISLPLPPLPLIFMEKEINILCIKPKSLYCPLLAGCNYRLTFLCFFNVSTFSFSSL